jgi:hypothetical protein
VHHLHNNQFSTTQTMNADFIEKYINPFTDYGFKRLFDEEANKDLFFTVDIINKMMGLTETIILKR